jgi:hypothetical protein
MSALRHLKLLAAWAACWSLASLADAQVEHCPPCCEHDFQWFEPVALDLDCQPNTPDCGMFFHYDKLYGTISGERTILGQDGLNQPYITPYQIMQTGDAIEVFFDPTDPGGDPIIIIVDNLEIVDTPGGVVGATIRDAGPQAEFGWGDRYELGFGDREGGWMLGIADGVDQSQSNTFGWGFQGQEDTGVDDGLGIPSPYPGAPNQAINPLGGVYIPFLDPQGLMVGFIDMSEVEVTDGPPGGTLEDDDNEGGPDGVLDGDGFADDIDADGQFGPDGFDTDDTYGPDSNGFFPPDFDDLVFLPTTWQTVVTSNRATIDGVELSRFHNLRNDHMMAKHQNNQFRLMYGVRFVRLRDQFNVDAFGGTIGDSFWHTQIDNNIVGPQLGLSWFHQRQKFRFELNGRFMAGYNIGDWDQTAALGEELRGGNHNRPYRWNPTYSVHGRQSEDFSPLTELRAQLSYQVTTAISAKLGYTATYIGNVHRAASSIRYELPTMGFIDGSGENVVMNSLNFGVDVVY